MESKAPSFFERYPRIVTEASVRFLKKLVHEREINEFLEQNKDLDGHAFVEAVLDRLKVDFTVSSKQRMNIPASGKVLIIANHPLGGLDGLALLKFIGEVRRDVKIVANDLLLQFDPLSPLLLPVDNMSGKPSKKALQAILEALNNDEAVIFFPAGEVSRVRPTGVIDGKWKSGFLKMALKSGAPILPIRILAKNSSLFYGMSFFFKNLSSILLPNELFRFQSKTIHFFVGRPIPKKSYDLPGLSLKTKTDLLKQHLFKVGKKRTKKEVFATETPIAHPENRQAILKDLSECQLLGETTDNKKIYLYDYQKGSALMREIGRLREMTFRHVEEGSGASRDNDRYDPFYRHLVLWDEKALEVVGSYRIGETEAILSNEKAPGLYTASLFTFHKPFDPYLDHAIELGRSFVQPRYWGTRALDYLWQGIGAYLKHNPQIKTMFGPVSIPATYPKAARDLLVHFYTLYFGTPECVVTSNNPYTLSRESGTLMEEIFKGDDYTGDFRTLKEHLGHMGLTVPTLYKQYAEVCEPGGVKFFEFGVDPDFGNCVDGFIAVDVSQIKEAKRQRYMR